MTSSDEGSQTTSLDDSNKPVEQCEQFVVVSNLQFHIDGEFYQYFSLSIYLSIPKRLLPVTLDYNRRCSTIGLYYSYHTNIDLNKKTADQLGFEPGSP